MSNPLRRKIVLGLAALPAAGLARAAIPTPGTTEGPFFPSREMRLGDTDNDLVRVDGLLERAGGEIVRLRGRVLDRQGNPVVSARVEIWQCDVNGRYLHRRDSGGGRDAAFQGFGSHLTGADGVYRFRTIKPVPYSGRTPHIHVKVWADGRERLTTPAMRGTGCTGGYPRNGETSSPCISPPPAASPRPASISSSEIDMRRYPAFGY